MLNGLLVSSTAVLVRPRLFDRLRRAATGKR